MRQSRRMLSLLAGLCMTAAAYGQAVRDPAWERIFERSEGWTGADGAGTVLLPDGRLLWMFGDTWIGPVKDGKHGSTARLVNNSAAIHPRDLDPRDPASAARVQFAWGTPKDAGAPTSWISPTPEVAGDRESWYWPTGGGAVVPTAEGSERLLLFLWEVARTKEDRGIWSFYTAGNVVAAIDNWREPLTQWRASQWLLPHAQIAARRSNDAPPQPEVTWGQSALVEVAADGSRWLYVFGLRSEPAGENHLVLARVPAAQALDFTKWQFLATTDRWTANAPEAASVATGLVSEFSVDSITVRGRIGYGLIQSEPSLRGRVLLRLAERLQGPWSAPQAIYDVPELKRNSTYFTYAAKGHAAVSAPGELLITYLVNATDFQAMVNDPAIYRPMFLRLPLDSLPGF